MKEGKLIKKARDYSHYEVNNFFDETAIKKFKNNRFKTYKTCGSAALSVITTIAPDNIEKKLPKNQKHWSDRALCDFLRSRNYTVLPITRSDVTSPSVISNLITSGHVLITGQDVCQTSEGEREGSWF